MREIGRVVSVDERMATVRIDKKTECDKCGMCLFPQGASHTEFSADNTVGAKENDTVIIQTEKDGKLLGAVLVFLIPLILIGAAALIGYLLLNSELWVLALSVLFVILWYTILAVIDRKLKKTISFSPKIVEIIRSESCE